MSTFTETMFSNARWSLKGMVTGEPDAPVRHTWSEVHEQARRIAGGLARSGIGRGDAVAVLAGAPVEIAPTAQAIWMRGASLTMLHQPTPRTDLARWAAESIGVIDMIRAKRGRRLRAVHGCGARTGQRGFTRDHRSKNWLQSAPIDPVHTDDDDLALMQLTSGIDRFAQGRSDQPPQLRRQCRGDVRRRRSRP